MTRHFACDPLHAPSDNFTRLNLGCGLDIRQGFINLDKIMPDNSPYAFVKWDVERNLLGIFEDDSINYIFAKDVLNHLPHRTRDRDGEFWDHFVDDMIRVSSPGAVWEFVHPCRPRSLENGGHCRIVGVGSFNYWLVGDEMTSLEARSVTGSLRLIRQYNIRWWPRWDPRATFWRIVFEVVK